MDWAVRKAYQNQRHAIGIRVAVDAGALRTCRLHIDCLYRGGATGADRLRAAIEKDWGDLEQGCFASRRELHAYVEQMIENTSGEACDICARIRQASRFARPMAKTRAAALAPDAHSG